MHPIISTYRLQLRPDTMTLPDVRRLVGYLHDLGVSHLYLSPVLTAVDGSTHGYDVTDPTTVSAALGGREALAALVDELRPHGMGLVVDLVPNHVGVGRPRQNRWWWDVLRRGRASAYANYFDIDWEQERIAIPVLGDDGTAALRLDLDGPEPMLAYHELRYPIARGTEGDDPGEVHDRQAYELVPWRDGRIGYRRYLTIDSLAALRQEDPVVFAVTHREPASWFAADLVDGVRVDHVDGLTDPAGYLTALRDLLGPDRWLVVEHILAPAPADCADCSGADRRLDPGLPIDGTTGYDALGEITGVFVDPAGAGPLSELHREFTGNPGDAGALAAGARRAVLEVLRTELTPEVRRVVDAIGHRAATGVDAAALSEAVIETVAALPDAPLARDVDPVTMAAALDTVAAARPELREVLAATARALDPGGEAASRLRRLRVAAGAKAVEDRLFYRTARLTSLQELGCDPGRFAVPVDTFHRAQADRAHRWPTTMTTLSTHDTKRGEDVRARIGVLSQVPALWTRSVREWSAVAPSPDPTLGLLLWQTLFGIWPVAGTPTSTLRRRLQQYTTKAMREAAVHTAWTAVDDDYETRVHDWIDDVLDGPVAPSMTALVRRLAPHGRAVSVAQKLVQLTAPGIPDVYQGTELWEDCLTDPDNRRPIDFEVRSRLLAAHRQATAVDEQVKLLVTTEALRVRRQRPDSFVGGTYRPIHADGPAADHLLGFRRGDDVITLVARLTTRLVELGWRDTVVRLPPGTWVNRMRGRVESGVVDLADLFPGRGVALLVRDEDLGP